jgi:hypothetical protein
MWTCVFLEYLWWQLYGCLIRVCWLWSFDMLWGTTRIRPSTGWGHSAGVGKWLPPPSARQGHSADYEHLIFLPQHLKLVKRFMMSCLKIRCNLLQTDTSNILVVFYLEHHLRRKCQEQFKLFDERLIGFEIWLAPS